jgi:preprotein translocase subunit SecA
MEEGMAIEDKRITKGIVRAQRKVEERNFLARKNLLEYDEVMDYQRTTFYGMRQQVLEGREVDKVIWRMIGDAIKDAVDKYITQDYVAASISDWAKVNFETPIDPEDLRGRRNADDLEAFIKDQARAEAESNITSTLGEFLGEDPEDPGSWDMKELSGWAMSRFHVSLPINQIKKMSGDEVEERLREAAIEQIDKREMSGLTKYLEPLYAETELVSWAKEKFQIELTPQELIAGEDKRGNREARSADEIVKLIESRAREAYSRREVEYPVDHMLTYVYGDGVTTVENPYAAEHVKAWAKSKYNVELTAEQIREQGVRRLRDELLGLQEQYLNDGKLAAEVDEILKGDPKPEEVAERFKDRFGWPLDPLDLSPRARAEGAEAAGENGHDNGEAVPPSVREVLLRQGRQALRQELTDLEQFVLIQIFDQSWKDHLYAMDMLKGGIGLVGFAEKDPRIAYKKEGYRYFQEMMSGIRDKVTDLIFRARLGRAEPQARSAYRETAAVHEDVGGYGVTENLAATAGVNKGATVEDNEPTRASAGGETATAVKTIVNEAPRVGRNDPCPCGSGKKYKKCHGA